MQHMGFPISRFFEKKFERLLGLGLVGGVVVGDVVGLGLLRFGLAEI